MRGFSFNQTKPRLNSTRKFFTGSPVVIPPPNLDKGHKFERCCHDFNRAFSFDETDVTFDSTNAFFTGTD